jgi:hypothetical protein
MNFIHTIWDIEVAEIDHWSTREMLDFIDKEYGLIFNKNNP